jgi:FkbM family methyltransferase
MNFPPGFLVRLLSPERLTAVVDIGANPLNSDGKPPYAGMLAERLCTVVGFEPQTIAIAKLNEEKSDLETYLPYAIGDGSPGTLKVCRARGMTSLLTPDPRMLACFPRFTDYGDVIEEIAVETRPLDAIAEIGALDLLKMDVQGEELSVIRGGSARLAAAVAIQTEVSFMPLYKNQPLFGDIDLALRAQGFVPHMFVNVNKRLILPLRNADRPHAGLNQLLEADIVYVRDFSRMAAMTTEQIKHLAMIGHHCYASFDLTARCLDTLVARSAVPADALGSYMTALTTN